MLGAWDQAGGLAPEIKVFLLLFLQKKKNLLFSKKKKQKNFIPSAVSAGERDVGQGVAADRIDDGHAVRAAALQGYRQFVAKRGGAENAGAGWFIQQGAGEGARGSADAVDNGDGDRRGAGQDQHAHDYGERHQRAHVGYLLSVRVRLPVRPRRRKAVVVFAPESRKTGVMSHARNAA
jgi:hypothetical protein